MLTKGLCYIKMCPSTLATKFVNPCDAICLTVSDPSELPDPATGCEFALVRTEGVLLALYEWDGGSWNVLTGVIANDFTTIDLVTSGDWTITINGVSGLTAADSPYVVPSPVGYLDVTFTNVACSYVMERLEPVPELGFELIFDDIAVASGILGIVDINDVSEWNANTFMNFTSVVILGQKATFFGWNDTEIPAGAPCFTTGALLLQYVHDLDDHILSVADYAFQGSTALNEVWLNGCTAVGVSSFEGCVVLYATEFDSLITVADYGFNNTHTDLGTYSNITSIGLGGFGGCDIGVGYFPVLTSAGSECFSGSDMTSFSAPVLVDIPQNCCVNNLLLTSINLPLAETSGDNCFYNCPLLLSATLPSLITLGHGAFAFTSYVPDGVQNCQLPVCTTFALDGVIAAQFRNCGGLTTLYAPLLTAMGDPDDNTVFENITGNTMTITIDASLLTVDGGFPDGDLVYVVANNTVTLIPV